MNQERPTRIPPEGSEKLAVEKLRNAMKSNWMLGVLAGACVMALAVGCNDTKPAASAPATGKAETEKKAEKSAKEESKGPAGKWRLDLTEGGTAREFCIIEISAPDAAGKQTVQPLIMAANYDGAKMKTGEVQGDSVHMLFDAGDGVMLDFHARLTEQGLNGSLLIPNLAASPIRLVKTEVETLSNKEEVPLEGSDAFQKAASSGDGLDALNDFIQTHPSNALILSAYPVLLAHLKSHNAKQEEVQKLYDDCLKSAELWGGPVKVRASLDMAIMLSRLQYFPELAKKFLEDFQKQMKPDYPASWYAELALAQVGVGQFKEAVKVLTTTQKPGSEDIFVDFVLAKAYEGDKQSQKALDLYAKLAVMPMLEQMLVRSVPDAEKDRPSQVVTRLWQEIHKSNDGLEKYLGEIYEKQISALTPAREEVPARPQNARVELLELFTGTACPPCVAADISLSGIHHHYKPTEVVVVKYHEHNPAPDPFASEVTEKRFAFYQLEGTPIAALDGKVEEAMGGYTIHATSRYQMLRQKIDAGLQRTTPVQIDLSGVANQGKIRIKATVTGENFADDVRLRLAVLENGIHFKAPNGIRVHDCVVRGMPGGADGVAPKDKKLSFEGELVLADLKASLEKETARIEEKAGQLFAHPVGLKHLQLVAFVQDDSSKEVLQAKLIDIPGLESAAPAVKAEEKPAAKPTEKPAAKPVEKAPEKKEAEKKEPAKQEPVKKDDAKK